MNIRSGEKHSQTLVLGRDVSNPKADRRRKAILSKPVLKAGLKLELTTWNDIFNDGKVSQMIPRGEIVVHPEARESRHDKWEKVEMTREDEALFKELIEASKPQEETLWEWMRRSGVKKNADCIIRAMVERGLVHREMLLELLEEEHKRWEEDEAKPEAEIREIKAQDSK